MAVAANAVRATGGEICVVSDGQALGQVKLPLAGLVSEAPLSEVGIVDVFWERILETPVLE